jgi:membrane protease YdiL (CAAX protease family)
MLLHDYLKYFYAYAIFGREKYNALPDDTRTWMIQVTALVLCIITTLIIAKFNRLKTLSLFGLDKNPLHAFIVAACCTSVMFIGFWFIAPLRTEIGPQDIFRNALWAGFNEELIFRAFITGILVREAGWNFIPAALVSALLFAKGHLYQATNFNDAILIFLVTSGAGIGFAVFYWLWDWNIWFTIFLHFLMNLSFEIFDVGSTAMLNGQANIFRIVTLVMAIVYTVLLVYRRKKAVIMNRGSI